VYVKASFVQTENANRLREGVQMLTERGAREAAWMLITGRPGEGKTTTLYNWCAASGAVFITATQGMTPGRLVTAIGERLGLSVTARDLATLIGGRLLEADTPVVVDEAQFLLADNAAALERLRGITDKSATPVLLVSMERDVYRFGAREQISSRIFNWVEFRPASLEDVSLACHQLADVQIAPDLVARIHADTKGRMRGVLNAISRIEMAAKGLGKKAVAAADLRKTVLVEDYRASHDRLARRA